MSKKENGEYSFNDPPQKTEIKVDKIDNLVGKQVVTFIEVV